MQVKGWRASEDGGPRYYLVTSRYDLITRASTIGFGLAFADPPRDERPEALVPGWEGRVVVEDPRLPIYQLTNLPDLGRFIPKFGISMVVAPKVSAVLFGKAQRAVLALLFGRPDQAFYLSEIVSYADTGASQVQKELHRLTEAGLLLREKRGKQVYYRANASAPIFEELKSIVAKTFGIADAARDLLAPVRSRVDLAFIYGSVARGAETAASDVDVFVVGDLGVSDLAEALVAAEAKLRRTLSPTIYSRAEFVEKVQSEDHFITRVLEAPKIFLIGTQRALDELVQRQPEES